MLGPVHVVSQGPQHTPRQLRSLGTCASVCCSFCQIFHTLTCRFGSDGYIDIAVKDFNYWHKGSIDLTQIGFFVTTSEAEAQLEIDLAQVCRS